MLLVKERIFVEVLRHKKYELWSCTQISEQLVHTIPGHMNPANILDTMLDIGSKTYKTHKYVRRFTRSRQLSIRHISFIISIVILYEKQYLQYPIIFVEYSL